VHQVCAEYYAVGWVDECSIMVVIPTDSYWALTSLSMTCMTSLTYILWVYFITDMAFALSLNSNWQIEIECIGRLTDWFGFWHFRMVRLTLAHRQTNYHISQFGHWNQESLDTWQHWYTNCFASRYDVKNTNLPLYSSAHTEAVTMSSSESGFRMVISWGGYMQG